MSKDEAEYIVRTDTWYRLSGMLSPYTREEVKEAEEIIEKCRSRSGGGNRWINNRGLLLEIV